MKTCETCKKEFTRPLRRSFATFEAARFCSQPCVRRDRKPDSELSPKTRYRSVKVNGKRRDLHRVVAEMEAGRPLLRTDIVHHDNHNKLDNDPGNLVVTTPKDHSVHHNQKYPLTKVCVICEAVFTPHPTKRQRQQTCGQDCKRTLLSRIAREKGWRPPALSRPVRKQRSDSSGAKPSAVGRSEVG